MQKIQVTEKCKEERKNHSIPGNVLMKITPITSPFFYSFVNVCAVYRSIVDTFSKVFCNLLLKDSTIFHKNFVTLVNIVNHSFHCTILGTGDTAVNKRDKILVFMKLTFQRERQTIEKICNVKQVKVLIEKKKQVGTQHDKDASQIF